MARILEDEISGDPLIRGYSTMTDAQLLTSLNTADRSRNKTSMTGREVRDHTVDAEYDALTNQKQDKYLALVLVDDLNPFGTAANVMKSIFGRGSTTLVNLEAARVEQISRGVELGLGVVTVKDLRLHTIIRAQG